jgi:hypothetical protein
MYGLLVALSGTLVIYMVHVAVDPKPHWTRVAVMAVLVWSLAWTHYAGVVVGGAIAVTAFGYMVARGWRIEWRIPVAALIAALGVIPLQQPLRYQLEFVNATLYATLPGEVSGFFLWGIAGTGMAAILVAVVAVAQTGVRGIRRVVSDPESSALIGIAGGSAILAVATFVVLSIAVDIDMYNFGVSIVPPLLITLAAAALADRLLSRALVVLVLVGVVAAGSVAVWTNRDPSVFEPNRVSTLDALDDALNDIGISGKLLEETAVVHIDWDTSNGHFLDVVEERLPGLVVRVLPISRRAELSGLLSELHQADGFSSVVVISRIDHEQHIYSRVPSSAEWRAVGRVFANGTTKATLVTWP